jgi:hypothetical protein
MAAAEIGWHTVCLREPFVFQFELVEAVDYKSPGVSTF